MSAAPAVPGPFLTPPAPSAWDAFATAGRRALDERWVERIWARDASLWSTEPAVQEAIAQRLGWLSAPETFLDQVEVLRAFAATAATEFQGAIVAGMGGSSLAPEVLSRTFDVAPGGIPVTVLDSTDPEAVSAIDDSNPPAQTLYLIATKSGTTTETLAFLAYFWKVVSIDLAPQHAGLLERLREAATPGPESWVARRFAAITDPGRSVEAIPHADSFREVFLNPPDVGGRYSALTHVGLVPAALLGVDLFGLLGSAVAMAEHCHGSDPAHNPALALGLALGALARAGRDKLTLVLDPSVAALGAWIEQLVAESTGKDGRGIVPIDGEPLGPGEVYGPDRLFVRIALAESTPWRTETDPRLAELAAAGHPIIDLQLKDVAGLGGEFFRWEFATAVAGAVLGVNPFDEPNVTESKRNTQQVLEHLPSPDAEGLVDVFARGDAVLAEEPPLRFFGDAALRSSGAGEPAAILRRHLARARPDAFLTITAFVAPSPARSEALRRVRVALRAATRRATTVGYGPRYLHSTGQLHKGGTPSGWFLQLVAGHPEELAIPGSDHGFGVLIDAQAQGDFAALEGHGLPVLRVHLGDDPDAGLAALERALSAVLASP